MSSPVATRTDPALALRCLDLIVLGCGHELNHTFRRPTQLLFDVWLTYPADTNQSFHSWNGGSGTKSGDREAAARTWKDSLELLCDVRQTLGPGVTVGLRAPRRPDRFDAFVTGVRKSSPALQHVGHLVDQELEESGGLVQTLPGPGVCADRVDPFAAEPDPLPQVVFPVADDLVPMVADQAVHVATLAWSVRPGDEVHLDEVPDRARDGGRAGGKGSGNLGGGGRPVVLAQQQGEDPGRHPWHPAAHHPRREALDEVAG